VSHWQNGLVSVQGAPVKIRSISQDNSHGLTNSISNRLYLLRLLSIERGFLTKVLKPVSDRHRSDSFNML
jgi:hypothetical protein